MNPITQDLVRQRSRLKAPENEKQAVPLLQSQSKNISLYLSSFVITMNLYISGYDGEKVNQFYFEKKQHHVMCDMPLYTDFNRHIS